MLLLAGRIESESMELHVAPSTNAPFVAPVKLIVPLLKNGCVIPKLLDDTSVTFAEIEPGVVNGDVLKAFTCTFENPLSVFKDGDSKRIAQESGVAGVVVVFALTP